MPKNINIPLNTQSKIYQKPSESSTALRVTIITANDKKFEEIRQQLGDGYGMEVSQWIPSLLNYEESLLSSMCTEIMMNTNPSPHFILREETSLTLRDSGTDI